MSDAAFCPFVLEIFTLGITTGTTPTTLDPSGNVSRLQMAAFLSRTVDSALKRGSRRAAVGQFWTAQGVSSLNVTTIPGGVRLVQFDGADLWVSGGNTVARVRASDAKLLETWTGAGAAYGVAIAGSRVLVAGQDLPGRVFMIDPSQPAGAVTTVASNLGPLPSGIAFDGTRVWTANLGTSGDGSVSIVTPGASIPWTVTTVTVGTGLTAPIGAVWDGANIWVTDDHNGLLLKLDAAGAVLQTVTVGSAPQMPLFDGTNIWVPAILSDNVTVVRASTGAVLQVLTGNGLDAAGTAGFDGERVLVSSGIGNGVALFKAADLSPIGFIPTGNGSNPFGICSDGIHFWVALNGVSRLARF